MDEKTELSRQIIGTCNEMMRLGLNQGTAGNISARYEGGMLITPTGIPYHQLEASDIVLVDGDGNVKSNCSPSSEWRFHLSIYKVRLDVNAVVHNHPVYSTIISILNQHIPAIHYMIAAVGGNSIRCAPYATYGTQELSDIISQAVKDRNACLLQHHGMIAVNESLARALWLANEVEVLARQYLELLKVVGIDGKIPILPDDEIEKIMVKFASYGLQTR